MGKVTIDAAVESPKLSREEWELKKLELEVKKLQNETSPTRYTIWERLNKYLQRNVGQIAAVIVLLGSIITPVLNYVSVQRQQHLVQINGNILRLIVDTVNINNADLIEIATQDPKIVAPILLDLLNKKEVNHNRIETIFIRLYQINKDLTRYSFFDKTLFFLMDNNQEILENELKLNALKQFEGSYDPNVAKTYIKLMVTLNLDTTKKFMPIVNLLKEKSKSDPRYESLLKYYDLKKKQNAKE